MSDKMVHAIIVPWPISQGLHTWCGYRFDNPEVSGDGVASCPPAVTCKMCIEAMRDAYVNLSKWVPGLVQDGTPGIRDINAPCSDFAPGKPSGLECDNDGHHLCSECVWRKL